MKDDQSLNWFIGMVFSKAKIFIIFNNQIVLGRVFSTNFKPPQKH